MIELLLFSVLCFAVGGDDCPDQVVEHHEMTITDLNPQTCGGGLTFTYGGLTYQSPPNTCPLALIIAPAYDSTEHREDSNTYTVPVETLHSTVLLFECHTYWVFGIIPISAGTKCLKTGTDRIGAFTHYEQRPCTIGAK
jgi:hypothetical protein